MMLFAEHSQLRVIGIGPVLYTVSGPSLLTRLILIVVQGKWVLLPEEEGREGSERRLKLEVVTDIARDRWLT